jgi:hypothetical protein
MRIKLVKAFNVRVSRLATRQLFGRGCIIAKFI